MFNHCKTPAETKQYYKQLAFKLHPDTGGSHNAFVELQQQYQAKLKSLNGQTSTGFDNKEHTYYYSEAVETEIMEKINDLLALKMEGTTIELIGTWVWISGNTKLYREALKKLGLRWHSKRIKWFFHTKNTYKRHMSKLTFDQIRFAYGSRSFEAEKQEDRRAIA